MNAKKHTGVARRDGCNRVRRLRATARACLAVRRGDRSGRDRQRDHAHSDARDHELHDRQGLLVLHRDREHGSRNAGRVGPGRCGAAALNDGTAFTSGDLVVGRHVVAVYNGANFRTNIAPPTDAAITLSDIPNLPAVEDHERNVPRGTHCHAANASRLRRDHSRRDHGLLHQRLTWPSTATVRSISTLGVEPGSGGAVGDGTTLWFLNVTGDQARALRGRNGGARFPNQGYRPWHGTAGKAGFPTAPRSGSWITSSTRFTP